MSKESENPRFASVRDTLKRRLAEPGPTLLQLLVGPRQVGKTTLLLELEREYGERALYVSADAPESSLPGWGEQVWKRAEALAVRGTAILLIDEVHTLPDWSMWLKAHSDRVRRERIPLKVVATGSSSLKLGSGSRETMAGRFERLVLTHWGAADLSGVLGVPEKEAASRFVTHGGYPGAVRFWTEPERWRDYVVQAIIEPAIGRDILQLEPVRKPALLRQVFALAAAHPAEILSLEKIAGHLAEKGALETIAHYLHLLEEAYLVAPLQKHTEAQLRRRKSPPKLIVLNNALLAASRPPPEPVTDPRAWGRWVENACLAHAINRGNEVGYWREEPWEVDGVVRGPRGHWLLEVKTGAYTAQDLRGLAHAAARLPGFEPLVVCDPGEETSAIRAGFPAVSWRDFLLDRWPSGGA